MSELTIVTQSRAEQVYDRLREMITQPQAVPGQRLQSMRVLAERFGTSVPTVQRAMGQLESEGLLLRRQGSGTFIAEPAREPVPVLDRSVTLGIEVGGHVFGELANELLGHLHAQDCLVSLLDTSHDRAATLVEQLAGGDTSCLVLHGQLHILEQVRGVLGDLPVVGVVDWENQDTRPTTAVLCDHARGAAMALEHLWALGHRRLLLVGTSIQMWYARQNTDRRSPLPRETRRIWTEMGGSLATLQSQTDADGAVSFDVDALLREFAGDTPPTAIFALRDIEASVAQRLLRQHRLDLYERTAIVGYYDTPWSQSADPPITSVSVDVIAIAREAAARIAALQTGGPVAAEPLMIPPRLIVRASSHPAPAATTH